jgi:hypothetical protein
MKVNEMKKSIFPYFFGIIILFIGAYYADEIITGRADIASPTKNESKMILDIRKYKFLSNLNPNQITRENSEDLMQLKSKFEPTIKETSIELTCKMDSYSERKHIGGMRCITLQSDDVIVYLKFSDSKKIIDTFNSDIFKVKGEIVGIKFDESKKIGISTPMAKPYPQDHFKIILYINGEPTLMQGKKLQ